MENLSTYNFSEVVSPHITMICGVELYPYSMGHWLNLEKINSPFLPNSKNKDISIEHLILFLMICAQTYEEGKSMLEDYKIYNETKLQMEKHFMSYILFGKWIILNKLASFKVRNIVPFNKPLKKLFKYLMPDPNWNLRKEMFHISEYLHYFMEMPLFDNKHDEGIPSGIDWRQNIYTILKNEYQYDESKIMNMPLRRLFCEWCSYAEKQGAIRVNNVHDIEAMKMAGQIK